MVERDTWVAPASTSAVSPPRPCCKPPRSTTGPRPLPFRRCPHLSRHRRPAIGVTVVVTALLRAKDALHAVSHRFSDEDIKTFLQFAVVTAVVLPLVPDQAIGRFEGFNPREVWLMVVFVSAIGLAGYIAPPDIRF